MAVDDGVVVFSPASGAFADLNESAGELWGVLVAAGWAVNEAVGHLVETYDFPVDDAMAIVHDLITELERAEILVTEGSCSGG